jgi:hypothetical protein
MIEYNQSTCIVLIGRLERAALKLKKKYIKNIIKANSSGANFFHKHKTAKYLFIVNNYKLFKTVSHNILT